MLSQPAMHVARRLRGPASRIGFLVAYGHFRAAGRFFPPERHHERGIGFVSRAPGLPPDSFPPEKYIDMTRLRHRRRILDLHGFQPFDDRAEARLTAEVATMARVHPRPRLIFGRCVDFPVGKRTEAPGAWRLGGLTRTGPGAHRGDPIRLVDTHPTPNARQLLDSLFVQEAGAGRYRLTPLKGFPHSARPGKVREAAADLGIPSDPYRETMPVPESPGIGADGTGYHAGGARRPGMFQLRRRAEADRHLHAVAFIADQRHRLQDALVDMLPGVMRSFGSAVTRDHREAVFAQRESEAGRLGGMLDIVDAEVLGPLRGIRALVEDGTMSDALKLEGVRAVPDRGQIQVVDRLRADIRRGSDDGERYHRVLEDRSVRLRNRLSPILGGIGLTAGTGMADLMEAIAFFRGRDGHVDAGMPLAFMKPAGREAVLNGPKGFRAPLCKVFLFRHVAGAIKAGNLGLRGSRKHRPLDDCLTGRDRWRRERPELPARAGLLEFVEPDPVPRSLEDALQQRYENTSRAAGEGPNPHLRINARGDFRVAAPALEDVGGTQPSDILPRQHVAPLSEVLATVDQHCGMLGAFRHWQRTHVRQAPAEALTIAGIMGPGCAVGVRKMARISHAVTEREPEHAVNRRFSLDSIIAANDRAPAASERMELPRIHRSSQAEPRTSSDGQEFEVRQPSLNAGLRSGVSARDRVPAPAPSPTSAVSCGTLRCSARLGGKAPMSLTA